MILLRNKTKDCFFVLNYPSINALLVLLIIRPKCYSLEHANDDYLFESKPFGKIATWVLKKIKRRAFMHASGVLAVAEYLKNDYYPEHYAFISNVRIERVTSDIRIPPSNCILNFISVGAISKKKGSDKIIRALVGSDLSFRMTFIGEILDKSILDLIPEQKSNFFEFRGILTRDEVFKELQNAHIFLQASRAEGRPRALIEAMSIGLPCMANWHASVVGLLDDELIFDMDDRVKFEQCVNLILRGSNYRNYSLNNINKSEEFLSHKLEIQRTNYYSKVFSS